MNEKASRELTNILRATLARELRADLHKFLEKEQVKMNELVKLYTDQLRIDIKDRLMTNGVKPIIQIAITSPQIVIEEDKSKDIFEDE